MYLSSRCCQQEDRGTVRYPCKSYYSCTHILTPANLNMNVSGPKKAATYVDVCRKRWPGDFVSLEAVGGKENVAGTGDKG